MTEGPRSVLLPVLSQSALLIVDPQNDFITGTLPVPGAKEAMHLLADRIEELAPAYIFVTMDCHPLRHCSFQEEGGKWPRHCIKYSEGAAIEPKLMQALLNASDSGVDVRFIEKATDRKKDEYSAFEKRYPEIFDLTDEIMVAGLAGDVCVRTTITDLAKHGLASKLTVMPDASPSLDGGAILSETIKEINLKTRHLLSKEEVGR